MGKSPLMRAMARDAMMSTSQIGVLYTRASNAVVPPRTDLKPKIVLGKKEKKS